MFSSMLFRRCLSKKLLKSSFSSSSRPIAKFEQSVEDYLDRKKEIQRHNPGILNHSTVVLPDPLITAVDNIINSSSYSNLFQNAKILNDHLVFKKPPLTERQLEEIESACAAKLLETYPSLSLDTSYLSVEDEKRAKNSFNSKLKKTINQNTYKWKPVVYNQAIALAYLVSRLAPDFASLYRILDEIKCRDPHFQPQTLFDFGSGVGSALWAAKSCWGAKTFKEAFCVDSSVDMNNLSLALIHGGVWQNQPKSLSIDEETKIQPDIATTKGLYFRQFMPVSAAVKYDLVICAHTLLELPTAELRLQMALSLWRKSQGYLVFVEHGSRAAYELIVEIRDFLLSLSKDGKEPNLQGHVFAPCAHESHCPRLAETTPCNFEVKYQPLFKSHQVYKERFSYVVLKKGPKSDDDCQWPRIVRPVLIRSGHSICRLCTKEGKLEEIVVTRSKHSKSANRFMRKIQWGDLLPVKLSPRAVSGEEPSPDDGGQDYMETIDDINETREK